MKPRITVLTIGVDDLERSLRFYRGLGFESAGIVGAEFEQGAVAFFDLQEGLRIAAWRREDLAHDCGLPGSPASPTEFSLGHNVGSVREVDAVMAQAAKAGATIAKSA